ncbi:MAG: DUF2085 domain-containing protein [Ktedonobacterales bacterium]
MSTTEVERKDPAAVASALVERPGFVPPVWLIAALAAAYIVALALLAFLPGATLIERLRALDGGICAQLPSHSFWPGGQQLPLCSRNTGIYSGFTATLVVLWLTGRLRSSGFPGRWVMVALGLAVLLMSVDGFNSLFLDLGLPHLYQPHNLLRLATGLGTGVAMCAVLVPVANTLIWREDDEISTFRSIGELSVMLPVLLLIFLAVGSTVYPQFGFLLYPIAIFSSFGLVIALTLVNVVFVLGLSNRVGRFASWRQFFPYLTIAVVLAIIELMALFQLKTAALLALAHA